MKGVYVSGSHLDLRHIKSIGVSNCCSVQQFLHSVAEEFYETPLHFLPLKPFRPAHWVTLLPKKAQIFFHWASPSPCCHSSPPHSQPTNPTTESALVYLWITWLPWYTQPKLQCKAISQLAPTNGEHHLETLYCAPSPG